MEVGLIILLAAGILLLGLVSLSARRHGRLDHEYFRHLWRQVEELASAGDSGRAAAIIQADKTLDQALKRTRVPGATMAERIKAAEARFRDKEAVWRAHKLRNRLVHDEHIKLGSREISHTLAVFLRALKDLGAL